MNDKDKELELTRHRMEVLRIARQMLNEEYINRRAEDHNKWLADADVAWRTKGIRLPYPPFAPYPTEEQVLVKAKDLLGFVVGDCEPETPQEEPVPKEVPAPEEMPAPEEILEAGKLFADIDSSSPRVRMVSNLSPLTQAAMEGKI